MRVIEAIPSIVFKGLDVGIVMAPQRSSRMYHNRVEFIHIRPVIQELLDFLLYFQIMGFILYLIENLLLGVFCPHLM